MFIVLPMYFIIDDKIVDMAQFDLHACQWAPTCVTASYLLKTVYKLNGHNFLSPTVALDPRLVLLDAFA
jgi:hypothetical protein